MSVRSVLGMVVVIAGLAYTTPVLTESINRSMDTAYLHWSTGQK